MIRNIKEANGVMQEVFGKTFEEMRQFTSSNEFTNTAANEFLNDLSNKLLRQIVIDSFTLESKILSKFMVDGLNVSTGEEIIESQLITESEYDPTVFIPKEVSKSNQLKMYLSTKDKKKWNLTVNRDIISRAFTNIPAFNSFIENYLSQIRKSAELYIYSVIIDDIAQNVKVAHFTRVVPTDEDPNGFTPIQQSVIDFLKHKEMMTDVPTNEYNLDGRGRKIEYIQLDDLVMLANPSTLADVQNLVLPKLYNDSYLDIKKIDTIKIARLNNNELILMDKKSYRIFKRIEEFGSQYFVNNMMLEWVLHIWLTRGVVNWMPAFKYIINDGKTPFMYHSDKEGTAVKVAGSGLQVNTEIINDLDTPINHTMGEKDWIVARILDDETRAILGDTLITGNAAYTNGPDDLLPSAKKKVIATIKNGTTLIATTDVLKAAGITLKVDQKIIVQVFGYIDGLAFATFDKPMKVVA